MGRRGSAVADGADAAIRCACHARFQPPARIAREGALRGDGTQRAIRRQRSERRLCESHGLKCSGLYIIAPRRTRRVPTSVFCLKYQSDAQSSDERQPSRTQPY